MFKTLGRLISAGVFLLLTALLVLAAKCLPTVWFSFYTPFSKKAVGLLGGITAWFPWAMWEVLLVLLILGILIWLIWAISKKKLLSWLTGAAELIALLVFLYVAVWGLNYFDKPLDEKLGYGTGEYTQSELEEAAAYFAAAAGAWADQVDRNADGEILVPSFEALSQAAVAGCNAMEEDFFHGPSPRVKQLILPEVFNYMGIAGVFVDLTGEASVNPDTYPASLPFTMCHELSHSLTVAAEDQANFSAFLICANHSDPLFRYSGYYDSFIYLYNRLYETSPTAAQALWAYTSDNLKYDCGKAREQYEQYDGKVQAAAEQINDVYLKTFAQEDGVQSYDLVTRDLIAYYYRVVKPGLGE